ncbi:MAG: glycosyltransferase family 2 protein [Betaproteobacteria bacterium]|jgi:glycosyltransferase involved in cell wall biosynthesis|nr:glycosyltransferase family 2 protein [Betaproteobacteria bacterium]
MADTLPLSLVVITRDAAAGIAQCLASFPLAGEALVVDSGSADDTVEIARARGARVLRQEWLGFGAQKRFAVDAAAHDWVMCMDADERATPELVAAVAALFASGAPSAPAYAVARRNRFLGRWLAHGEGYPDWNVRLFDRRRARWTDDPVHEHVVADGAVGRLAGDLLHDSADSIADYVAKQNRYTSLQAEAMHARGEQASAARIALAPIARFLRFYVLKLGFLDGAAGFAHVAIGAFASFLKYVKLSALNRRRVQP